MKPKRSWRVGDIATLCSPDMRKSVRLVVKAVQEDANTIEFNEPLPEWCGIHCKLIWEPENLWR